MGKIYFIGDLHFQHNNIISLDGQNARPYENTNIMEKDYIAKWNSRVHQGDTVYIVGDFCFSKNPDIVIPLLKKLKGKKILIKGNHDKYKSTAILDAFDEIKDMDCIHYNGQRIIICHYPIASWNSMQRGCIHIYAHVHMTHEFDMYEDYLDILHSKGIPAYAYNVGAMCPWMDGYPRTIEEIREGYQLWRKENGKD